jgi:hypothetical protein
MGAIGLDPIAQSDFLLAPEETAAAMINLGSESLQLARLSPSVGGRDPVHTPR